jgi:hypothetical protein
MGTWFWDSQLERQSLPLQKSLQRPLHPHHPWAYGELENCVREAGRPESYVFPCHQPWLALRPHHIVRNPVNRFQVGDVHLVYPWLVVGYGIHDGTMDSLLIWGQEFGEGCLRLDGLRTPVEPLLVLPDVDFPPDFGVRTPNGPYHSFFVSKSR